MKKISPASAGILILLTVFVACQKERTYAVEEKGGTRFISNIKARHDTPALGLEFALQIGEMEPEDQNDLFVSPMSVAEDSEGNIFILDDRDGCVKKFTPDGKFILRFGRLGQGPGEFQYPMQIDCRENKLLITSMSFNCHLFDLGGNFNSSFQLSQYEGFFLKALDGGHFVGYSFAFSGENSAENKILKIFDSGGNTVQTFGVPHLLENVRDSWQANFATITVDADNNIYLSFAHQNRIDKYSKTGDLLMQITRDIPIPLEYKRGKRKMEIRGEVREIDQLTVPLVSRGIGIDGRGNIWVLAYTKEIDQSNPQKMLDYHDFLAFEVYSPDGVLTDRVPFPEKIERFDNVTMKGDNVYFVDPFGQACVYKYRVVRY